MRFVPTALLKKLYNRSSLRNIDGGARFSLKNRLSPAALTAVRPVTLDGQTLDPGKTWISVDGAEPVRLDTMTEHGPVDFPLGTLLTFTLECEPLADAPHELRLEFETDRFGALKLTVSDSPHTGKRAPDTVPRDAEDDYSESVIGARQAFVREHTGVELEHIARYSFDPHEAR
ncbi:MAG: hypothetical protein ACPGJE_06470, partial [Wenzhouxiangellaceae bacterium]